MTGGVVQTILGVAVLLATLQPVLMALALRGHRMGRFMPRSRMQVLTTWLWTAAIVLFLRTVMTVSVVNSVLWVLAIMSLAVAAWLTVQHLADLPTRRSSPGRGDDQPRSWQRELLGTIPSVAICLLCVRIFLGPVIG